MDFPNGIIINTSNSMTARKWDELNNDCLTQIFARVETESLVRFIPFVCKSWYRATLDPQCWTTLTFSSVFYPDNFVKYAVGRAQRSATVVEFKTGLGVFRPDLLCIAEGCPLLKTLILPNDGFINSLLLSELIGNWKHLEYLQIRVAFYFEQILESISLHCHNFVAIVYTGTRMSNKEVLSIVKFIPKIKFLRMRDSWLTRECLVMLLKGCTSLETLDVSGCFGVKADDEIMILGSHINSFKCRIARLDYKSYLETDMKR